MKREYLLPPLQQTSTRFCPNPDGYNWIYITPFYFPKIYVTTFLSSSMSF
jgi:hypothetical protein